MPVDPKGGGSWLAVNQSGFTFALLNYYQGRQPKGRLHSRGQIIKALVGFSSVEQVKTWLSLQDLHKFAPFSLLVFDSQLGLKNTRFPRVPLFRWNGKQLEIARQSSPLMSSALNFERVCDVRRSLYEKTILQKEEVSDENFLQLHRSHIPEKSRYSLCMHRDDAHTVSFSKVTVSDVAVCFQYSDGAPCQSLLLNAVSLPRLVRQAQSPPYPSLRKL